MVYRGSIEGPSRVHRGSIKGPSRVHQVSIEGPSRVHRGSIEGLWMVYRGSIKGLSRAHRWSIECILMLVKVSMNGVISRLKRAWKKEKYFYFYQTQYRLSKRLSLTMNYQGVSRGIAGIRRHKYWPTNYLRFVLQEFYSFNQKLKVQIRK